MSECHDPSGKGQCLTGFFLIFALLAIVSRGSLRVSREAGPLHSAASSGKLSRALRQAGGPSKGAGHNRLSQTATLGHTWLTSAPKNESCNTEPRRPGDCRLGFKQPWGNVNARQILPAEEAHPRQLSTTKIFQQQPPAKLLPGGPEISGWSSLAAAASLPTAHPPTSETRKATGAALEFCLPELSYLPPTRDPRDGYHVT